MRSIFVPKSTRAAVAYVVAGGVMLGLAACTGSNDDGAGHASEPAAIDRVAQGFPAPRPQLSENDATKAGDVTIDTCDVLEAGGMRAHGTVTNGTDEAQRYQILIYFVSDDDTETVAHNWASTAVNVPPGESVPFVAERAFDTGDATLSCQVQAVN